MKNPIGRTPARHSFRLTHPAPRVVVGTIAALAALSASYQLFGPMSDLNARQLAAGPSAAGLDPERSAIDMARTDHSRGADERQRYAAGALVPIARVARARTRVEPTTR